MATRDRSSDTEIQTLKDRILQLKQENSQLTASLVGLDDFFGQWTVENEFAIRAQAKCIASYVSKEHPDRFQGDDGKVYLHFRSHVSTLGREGSLDSDILVGMYDLLVATGAAIVLSKLPAEKVLSLPELYKHTKSVMPILAVPQYVQDLRGRIDQERSRVANLEQRERALITELQSAKDSLEELAPYRDAIQELGRGLYAEAPEGRRAFEALGADDDFPSGD